MSTINIKELPVREPAIGDKRLTVAGDNLVLTTDPNPTSEQADWDTTTLSDPSFIKNKPTNLSDFNNDQTFIPEAPEDGGQYVRKDADWKEIVVEQIVSDSEQADWDVTDTESAAFIKNKPTNLSDFNNDQTFIPEAPTDGQGYVRKDAAWAVAETGGGVGDVDSVNGETGVVVLDADDIDESTTRKWLSPTERTKLTGIASGAQVNTVDSVNGETGVVVLDADDILEGTTNKYFPEAPTDGQGYVRKGAAWAVAETGGAVGEVNVPYSRIFMDCLNDPSAPLVKPDGTVTTIGGIGKLMGRSKYKIPNSFYFETTKVSSSNDSGLYLMFCPVTTDALGDTTDFTKGFGVSFLQTDSENTVSVGTVVGTSLTDRTIIVNSPTDSFPCNVGDTIGFSVQPDGLDMHIIANNITQGTTLTHTHNDGATNWTNVLLDFSVIMSGIDGGTYTLNTGQSEFLGDSQGFSVLDHVPLGVNRSRITLWEGSKNSVTQVDDYKVKGLGNWYITSGSSTPYLVTVSNLQTRHSVERTTTDFLNNTMAVNTVTARQDMSSISALSNNINLSSSNIGLAFVPTTKVEYSPL